jgi:hypothetical protein
MKRQSGHKSSTSVEDLSLVIKKEKEKRNRSATPKKRKINKWQAFSFQNTIIIFLKKNLHVAFIIIYFYYYIIKLKFIHKNNIIESIIFITWILSLIN